jgi:hypothetical protein
MSDHRIRLTCACGREHTIDAAPDEPAVAPDPRGELVALNDGFGPVAGATLLRWARTGRLRAFRAARRRWVAWTVDVAAAIEREPVPVRRVEPPSHSRDRDLLDDPRVEVA